MITSLSKNFFFAELNDFYLPYYAVDRLQATAYQNIGEYSELRNPVREIENYLFDFRSGTAVKEF